MYNQTGQRAEKIIGDLEQGHALLYSSGISCVLAPLHYLHPNAIAIGSRYHNTNQLLDMFKQVKTSLPISEITAEEYDFEFSSSSSSSSGDVAPTLPLSPQLQTIKDTFKPG